MKNCVILDLTNTQDLEAAKWIENKANFLGAISVFKTHLQKEVDGGSDETVSHEYIKKLMDKYMEVFSNHGIQI